MPVTVHLPIAWRSLAGGSSRLTADQCRVDQLLAHLEALYPALAGRFMEGDRLHPSLNVLVNATDTRLLNELATELRHGDEVHLILEFGRG